MEKIIFSDNSELEIQGGASLDRIVVVAQSFSDLQTIADMLVKENNLNNIKFVSNDLTAGEYKNMKVESPLFRDVDITEEGLIQAAFSIREKTQLEKTIEELRNSQSVQDGAIADLGVMLSDMLEGREV